LNDEVKIDSLFIAHRSQFIVSRLTDFFSILLAGCGKTMVVCLVHLVYLVSLVGQTKQTN
jgi:hypothetical protein